MLEAVLCIAASGWMNSVASWYESDASLPSPRTTSFVSLRCAVSDTAEASPRTSCDTCFICICNFLIRVLRSRSSSRAFIACSSARRSASLIRCCSSSLTSSARRRSSMRASSARRRSSIRASSARRSISWIRRCSSIRASSIRLSSSRVSCSTKILDR